MDSQSRTSPEATTGFLSVHSRVNSDVSADFLVQSAACNLCGTISSANETTADFETLGLCSDCKFLLIEDFENRSHSRRRQSFRRRVRTRDSSTDSIEELLRHSSTESIELFTQQFADMINVARQEMNDDQSTDYSVGRLPEGSSSQTNSSDSRSRRMAHSDTESETDQYDSQYGESDSNSSLSQFGFFLGDSNEVSFSTHGEESDAGSVDLEILIHPNVISTFDTDTDIDPMHAGVIPWNSDEDTDPDEDTTASRITRTGFDRYLTSPSESNGSVSQTQSFNSSDFENMLHLRIRESRPVLPPNVLTSLDDYINDMSFETILGHLAETDSAQRGAPPAAPPAAESFVKNLPSILISQEHIENNDGLACAICKDQLTTLTIVNKLPCNHLYHPNCINQWLSVRNSCPICRYELPTDDKDYETQKLNSDNGIDSHGIPVLVASDEDSSDNDEDVPYSNPVMTERNQCEDRGFPGRRMWFFLAAAPVVSLVGIVLAVWFSDPQSRGFTVHHNLPQMENQRGDRSRRWWPFL